MVEIRISSAQAISSRSAVPRESEVFVFDDESDAVLVQRWQRGDSGGREHRHTAP